MADNCSNKFEQSSHALAKGKELGQTSVGPHSDKGKTKNGHAKSKPWDSPLDEYIEEIAEMRGRKRPVSYRAIAKYLLVTYADKWAHSSIASFVKARSMERYVFAIDKSFLKHKAPAKASQDDPVERLRKKPAPSTSQQNDEWNALKVEGPLIKE